MARGTRRRAELCLSVGVDNLSTFPESYIDIDGLICVTFEMRHNQCMFENVCCVTVAQYIFDASICLRALPKRSVVTEF